MAEKKISMTKDMSVDIDAVPEGKDPIVEIPLLNRIPSWREIIVDGIDKTKLARYIVMLYSFDSILNQRNPIPLEQRKVRALHFAGLKQTDQVKRELMGLENDGILRMIQDFLIAQDNYLWMEIVATEQQYQEAFVLRMQPIDKNAKDKDILDASAKKRLLSQHCKEMTNDLKANYKKFYAGHEDLREQVRVRASSLEGLAKSALDV